MSLAEETLTADAPTVMDLTQSNARENEFSILKSAPAQASNPNGSFVPTGPLALQTNPFDTMQNNSDKWSKVWTAVQLGLSGMMQDKNLASHWRALILQEHEQRRQAKSAQETQSITAMFGAAMASGDPEQLANVMNQFTKLKGLEPETIQNMQRYQLNAAAKLSGDQEETRMLNHLLTWTTQSESFAMD